MKKNFQFADRLNVQNKTVLLRLDVNVPTNAGVVTDDTRIRRIIPGILSLIDAGAKIVVLTHFGRPKGKVVESLSVRPVADCMSAIINQPIHVEKDVIGAGAKAAVEAMTPGQIIMLENLRFFQKRRQMIRALHKAF